ncbi:MAG: HDOD domain-containing protein [Thalassotalea sp.]
MKAIDYVEQASDLFVMSDSFIRIKELIDDEASTIDEIADVILLDPALSGNILKLANSTLFNYPGKIDTISKAVLVLGITEVYNLVIAYFTTEAFKSMSADVDFLEEFWERSVDCALLIKFLGVHLGFKYAERLFILGLLHNLGELVVKQFIPDKVPLCQLESSADSIYQKQMSVLSFTFSDCSSELLKIWQLPFSLIEPIRYQDEDNLIIASTETKLLYIAKRVMIANRQFSQEAIENFIDIELLQELGITPDVIEQGNAYCDLERLSLLSILKPSSMMIY